MEANKEKVILVPVNELTLAKAKVVAVSYAEEVSAWVIAICSSQYLKSAFSLTATKHFDGY